MTTGSGNPGTQQGLAGRYQLQSVDGLPLPCILEESEEVSTEVSEGRIDIGDDGGFTMHLHLRFFDANNEELAVESTVGVWLGSGLQLRLIDSLGTTRFGSVHGERLTLSGDPAYVFVR